MYHKVEQKKVEKIYVAYFLKIFKSWFTKSSKSHATKQWFSKRA